tara:strand:+ start:593 stop:817 length:225 start_codon:yes stop_codon:yes gene_type:complete
MDPRRLRLKIRLLTEMGDTMLSFDSVIGLTTVDPAAIHTDAHASRCRIKRHSEARERDRVALGAVGTGTLAIAT